MPSVFLCQIVRTYALIAAFLIQLVDYQCFIFNSVVLLYMFRIALYCERVKENQDIEDKYYIYRP